LKDGDINEKREFLESLDSNFVIKNKKVSIK
jgi:hypothetical protein